MAFRIQHIPTGRYLKKLAGSTYWAVRCCLDGNINQGTTTATGYLYAKRRNAEVVMARLVKASPKDWRIVGQGEENETKTDPFLL